MTVCDWRRRRAARDRPETLDTGQFRDSPARLFDEARYAAPRKAATIFRLPLAYGAFHVSTRTLAPKYTTPSMRDIYDFMSALFLKAHLSSECSVVCLIYVERLMEKAHVPFDDRTWRPVLLCSMLLAWYGDWRGGGVEFSAVFPQFGLAALNRLERVFVTQIGWDVPATVLSVLAPRKRSRISAALQPDVLMIGASPLEDARIVERRADPERVGRCRVDRGNFSGGDGMMADFCVDGVLGDTSFPPDGVTSRAAANRGRSVSQFASVHGCALPSTRRAVSTISSAFRAWHRPRRWCPVEARVNPPHLEREFITISENPPRHRHRFAHRSASSSA